MLNVKKLGINNILLVIAITILIIATSTCVFYSTVDNTVLAETTSDSLLNFNQLLNKDTINLSPYNFNISTNYILTIENYSNTSETSWFQIFNRTGLKNHKFYFKFNTNNNILMYNANFGTSYSTSQLLDSGNTDNVIFYIRLGQGQADKLESVIQLIDLTQMYGGGNEPTLEECEKIFITNYKYTEKNIINNESFYNYTQGIIDYNKEITFEIIPQTILKNSTVFNYGEYKSSDLTTDFTNTGNLDIEVIGGFRFNLGYTISQGATLTINIAQMINTNGNLYIGYLDNNNNVLFFNYNGIDQGENLEFTFTISQDIDHLIFLSSSNVVNTDILKTNTAEAMFLDSPTISVQTTNIDGIINMIYQNAISTFNTDYYYNKGYNAGITAGKAQGTAWGNSWEFISSCFNGVGDILAIEILPNLPLYTFIAVPLLLGLIVLIYKLIGSGG